MTHECGEVSLDVHGHVRTCALDSDHDGAHVDPRGESWEPPQVTLVRLQERWGRTHAIAWTGRMWIATAHDKHSPWRTEIEPTPAQLEQRLRSRSEPYRSIPRPRRER